MRFNIQDRENNWDFNFTIIYRHEEYSFDVEESIEGHDFTSIMVNDLQLEINDEGKIIYVWRLCPLIEFAKTDEFPREYKSCNLVAILDKPPIPGISYRINETERWPIYINKKKGWVCIESPNTKNKQLIEFAPNCVATMEGQEIVAVWLHAKKLSSELFSY